MNREQAMRDISQRFAILTLDEEDFDFDFVVEQLAGIKDAIVELNAAVPQEPWLGKWLEAEHVKGGMLYVAAITNYRKQLSDGLKPPFDPQTRAGIVGRFNRWSNEARARVAAYESNTRTADVVADWMRTLAAFHADPLRND